MAKFLMMAVAFAGSFFFSLASLAAEPSLASMDLTLRAEMPRPTIQVRARFELKNVKAGQVQALWTPGRITRFFDEETGRSVPFQVLALQGTPPELGYGLFQFRLPADRETQVLRMEYSYDSLSFGGFALNPATKDPLLFGQLSSQSIYSTHVYYYPFLFGGPLKSSLRFELPWGWRAVTSGVLDQNELRRSGDFVYKIERPSPSLPYPLAIFPYDQISLEYQKRFRVTVHYTRPDLNFADQKLRALVGVILPFLERLMGPYPFESLRVVEVFPARGNTGVAAQGVILLSDKIWFQSELDPQLSNAAAEVLVDEAAHQWNFHLARMPNFLAEGMSQYTSAMFLEHVQGRAAIWDRLIKLQDSFDREALLLRQLFELRRSGLSLEQAAARLEKPVEEISPFWPYALWGEVPITDSRVFPSLVFTKGALALNALRGRVTDRVFFTAFRKVFEQAKDKPDVSLAEFQKIFEAESRQNLNDFFRVWYGGLGLPQRVPPRPALPSDGE